MIVAVIVRYKYIKNYQNNMGCTYSLLKKFVFSPFLILRSFFLVIIAGFSRWFCG